MKYRLHRRLIPLLVVVICAAMLLGWVCAARGEGGEPRYFAIKNARIVPVSGAVIENGTVVIAKGLIQAVGASVTIPPEAWVIDGKGLTVYPGLIDAGTNIGITPDDGAEGNGTAAASALRDPEDRPGTTPWRVAADELKPDDKRIESWRSAGFTTSADCPRRRNFSRAGRGDRSWPASAQEITWCVRGPRCPFPSSPSADFSAFPIR